MGSDLPLSGPLSAVACSTLGFFVVSNLIVSYLNRLSDWLFVMARLANLRAGVEDVPWEK